MRSTALLIAGLAVAVTFSGCTRESPDGMSTGTLREWSGKNVRVQFRRDALGSAAALPVPPTTGEINGAATCVIGTLIEVEHAGIVIGPDERPKWIPREVILFVEANP